MRRCNARAINTPCETRSRPRLPREFFLRAGVSSLKGALQRAAINYRQPVAMSLRLLSSASSLPDVSTRGESAAQVLHVLLGYFGNER